MSFWRRLIGFGFGGAGFRNKGLQSDTPAYTSNSAVPVTLDGALQLSAVWACTKILAESVASLPINIYKKNRDGTRSLLSDHNLSFLFNGTVNAWQTKNEFFETLMYQKVLMGNSYCLIQRNKQGEIYSLTPLMSEQMEVALTDDNKIVYKYTDGAITRTYSQQEIWHSKLFGNGIIGLSPLGYARNMLGIGLATEQAVTNIYQNGGKPSGILSIDKVLTSDQRKATKDQYAALANGNNDNRLFILEAGMKYQPASLSPQDIELLASRRFTVEDICRFFGVPGVLVNDTSTNTAWGSGIQQIVQGFYKFGLRPYLERLEASMKCWLLTSSERQKIDIEFDFNALLRPDQAERIKTYKEGVQGGILTPNEARWFEGWEAKEGGDNLLVQQQMIPITKAGQMTASIQDKGGQNDE